jgi:hypothetical protein
MINTKLWSAVLIAATTLATPALAVGSNADSRPVRIDRRIEVVPREYYTGRHGCTLAPRIGAFPTEPWTNGPPLRTQHILLSCSLQRFCSQPPGTIRGHISPLACLVNTDRAERASRQPDAL